MRSRFTPVLLILALLIGLNFFTPTLHAETASRRATTSIFVDTDTGIDDAVALSWLLSNPTVDMIGITTVAGNTSVENATRNVLTILDVADRVVPVTMGAAAPLVFPATTTGSFIHGPDGFWGAQMPQDIRSIPNDAPAAIAAAARAHPGMTLLALGPLTNVALAAQRYPADLAGVNIIALGGSRGAGNRTPVAEYNMYTDPQALEQLLDQEVMVTLVPLEIFTQITFDSDRFASRIGRRNGALGRMLEQPVRTYLTIQGPDSGSIPDLIAAMLAVHPELGPSQSALVKVMTDDGLTRGQTIIATDPKKKIPMIASDAELSELVQRMYSEPGFDFNAALAQILAREPDNARVVTSLEIRSAQRFINESW